ncbi:hypothetical protein SLEP1_g52342 [Rubroshorea leprosula]|uniref:Uncharacterized protein n=1 Tax=Rubroshorea leprosula TaxID=152421 RepID=A0AAV5M5X7_9ROSI|nr:hypothetical protein SLEP1_g52342 [Rubroshorea leprosula]
MNLVRKAFYNARCFAKAKAANLLNPLKILYHTLSSVVLQPIKALALVMLVKGY